LIVSKIIKIVATRDAARGAYSAPKNPWDGREQEGRGEGMGRKGDWPPFKNCKYANVGNNIMWHSV